MNLIITSEMRVGSRWLHYLLSDLYHMGVSPEVDQGIMDERLPLIRKYMDENRIAKFHHATHLDIMQAVRPLDYSIIGVVRNPRDRMVSRAFHKRYDRSGKPAHFDSDEDAVNWSVSSDYSEQANSRQIQMMQDGFSTRNYEVDPWSHPPYIWTSYEWMKENIVREVHTISKFLGAYVPLAHIRKICEKHNFKNRSGREEGEEKRNDRWRRKGIVGDWINWFTVGQFEMTREAQDEYWRNLLINNGGNNGQN